MIQAVRSAPVSPATPRSRIARGHLPRRTLSHDWRQVKRARSRQRRRRVRAAQAHQGASQRRPCRGLAAPAEPERGGTAALSPLSPFDVLYTWSYCHSTLTMTGHTASIEEPALSKQRVAESPAAVERGRWGT